MGVGMWWRDSTHQLIRAVLVTLLGTVPVQAQSQALDGRPQSVEPSETQGDGQPHLARWADGETHGAVFLQVAGVLDLAAPTPESSGFAVLVRGSDDGFLVLQAVGGVQRDPLVIRNGEWTPATDADRAWIEEMVRPMVQKLGDSVPRLSIRGEGLVAEQEVEQGSRWSGSSKSGFSALSTDSERGIVQAAWLDEGCRYGVYGVLDPAAGDGLRQPEGVEDFRHFVGFRWDPLTQRLEVVGPDSYTVSGAPLSPQAGDDLRMNLITEVVSLMGS